MWDFGLRRDVPVVPAQTAILFDDLVALLTVIAAA
jgi:hypothetical protein